MKLLSRPALCRWTTAIRSAALLCAVALLAACSKSGDNPNPLPDDTECSVLFREEPGSNAFDCSYRSGQIDLEFHAPAGTAYVMTVTAGKDWCKTSRINQSTTKTGVMVSTTQFEYLYYEENTSATERTATIQIQFEGASTVVLTVRQGRGLGSNDDPNDDPNDNPNDDPKDDPNDDPNVGPGDDQGGAVVNSRKRWAELPVCVETADAKIVTHFASIAVDKIVRNYTLRYNTKKRIADWVAYPIHGCYMQGNYDRSDDWQFDPSFPQEDQANLVIGSYTNGNVYNRGHQCMSNHRYCNYSSTLNRQTFYATNSMPQYAQYNSGYWMKMEDVGTKQSCADTLYCVTGNFGVRGYTTDKEGKQVAIPEYCFKVYLRTVSGRTGKSIDQFTDATQLMAIGYYAENSANGNKGQLKDYCVSVAEVERLSGFEFFPMLDESIAEKVKAQCDPSKWGIN